MTDQLAQSPNTPCCSVVITTWKRPVLLRNTLRSLMEQSYPNYEVIVVCDGEDDEVRAIAEEFQHEQRLRWIFHSENQGLPAARNTGARGARGQVLLFLDDDVVADPDLVGVHMGHHRQAPPGHRLAVISLTAEERQTRLATYVDERLHTNWKQLLESFRTALSADGLESVGEEIEKMICFGLNGSISRDVFLSQQGFNEHFRKSDEEAEFGLRLYLAGVDFVFEARTLLVHRNSKSLAPYFRRCWGASGALSMFRVFELGQRNAQTRHLASVVRGYWMNRMVARRAWHMSRLLCGVSRWLESAANRTRSRALFSIWARSAQAGEFWSGAKAAGCTLAELERTAGTPKCAFMLHSLSTPASDREATYYVSPQRFRRFVRHLLSTGYRSATTAEWLNGDLPEKSVLLTFDDGYDDLYDELLPYATEHKLSAVIYLVIDRVGSSNLWDQQAGLRARKLLTWSQIREMQKYGFEFGSHTLTHPWLPGLSYQDLRREVSDSKHRLEDALGAEVTSFAYPSGGVDRRVRSVVAEAGFKLAFTTRPGMNWWNDPLCQRRAEINEGTSFLDFRFQLRTGYGFTRTFAERMSALEQDLPTSALRGLIRALHRAGHRALHSSTRRQSAGASS